MAPIPPLGPPSDKGRAPKEPEKADDKTAAVSAAGRRALSDSSATTSAAGGAGAGAGAGISIAASATSHLESSMTEYAEVTRRLGPAKMSAISAKILGLGDISAQINSLISKLEHPNWPTDSFFQDKNLPYYALEALRLKKITPLQFGTLMTFFHVMEKIEPCQRKIIPVFDEDGKLNPQIKEILSYKSTLFQDATFLETFLKEIRKKEKSEQVLILVESSLYGPEVAPKNENISIGSIILAAAGDNILNEYLDSSTEIKYRVVPSIGMMQTLLEELHKKAPMAEHPLRINVVVGESEPIEFLKGAFEQYRDVCVHFPEAPLPVMADGYRAVISDFTFHDFYHCLLVSSIPEKHRKLAADFYQALTSPTVEAEEAEVLSKDNIRAILFAKWKLIDLDFPEYMFAYFCILSGRPISLSYDVSPYELLLSEILSKLIELEKVPAGSSTYIAPIDYLIERFGKFLQKQPQAAEIRLACEMLMSDIEKGRDRHRLVDVRHRLKQLHSYLVTHP